MTDKLRKLDKKLLSDNWYVLNKYSFDYQTEAGEWQTQEREVYDRGNGAVVLLYDLANRNVILVKQFRLPTYLNGNDSADGMLIEACAGLLDADDPISCVIREAEEETGYRIDSASKIFESYMSPGAVTELLYFFVAEYSADKKVSEGGGLDEEHENIEVLEIDFDQAYGMIASGEISDAKTIMLLQYAKLHLFPEVMVQSYQLETATADDADKMASLRVEAMRESLERIGRFDEARAKDRFLSSYVPEDTQKIIFGGVVVGFYVLRTETDHLYLDHFYIDPNCQGQGVGSAVLADMKQNAVLLGLPIRLGALRESRSNDFYQKHGFSYTHEEEFDLYYEFSLP